MNLLEIVVGSLAKYDDDIEGRIIRTQVEFVLDKFVFWKEYLSREW
jgi:hypothetical protein